MPDSASIPGLQAAARAHQESQRPPGPQLGPLAPPPQQPLPSRTAPTAAPRALGTAQHRPAPSSAAVYTAIPCFLSSPGNQAMNLMPKIVQHVGCTKVASPGKPRSNAKGGTKGLACICTPAGQAWRTELMKEQCLLSIGKAAPPEHQRRPQSAVARRPAAGAHQGAERGHAAKLLCAPLHPPGVHRSPAQHHQDRLPRSPSARPPACSAPAHRRQHPCTLHMLRLSDSSADATGWLPPAALVILVNRSDAANLTHSPFGKQ